MLSSLIGANAERNLTKACLVTRIIVACSKARPFLVCSTLDESFALPCAPVAWKHKVNYSQHGPIPDTPVLS